MNLIGRTLGALIALASVAGFLWFVSACTARVSLENQGDPDAHYRAFEFRTEKVLLQGWGMDVSKAQPLVIGPTLEGVEGHIDIRAWHGVFSGGLTVGGNIRPASAIRIEVSDARYSYNIEVPRSIIIFDRTATSPETATITWGVDDYLFASQFMQYDNLGDYWRWSRGHSEPRVPVIQDSPGWPEIERLGMGQLLASHLEVVTIKLTEEQYQEYFQA